MRRAHAGARMGHAFSNRPASQARIDLDIWLGLGAVLAGFAVAAAVKSARVGRGAAGLQASPSRRRSSLHASG